MAAQAARPTDRLFWLVVLLVGVIVLAVVLGLQLFPRLSAGNQVLNNARPAFTAERVAGDRAGIGFVSTAVDLVDPLVTADGAAAEIPALIDFAEQRTGLSEATIMTLLQNGFPHTTGLLAALPLSEVNAELPGLVAFLSENLNLTPEEVTAAIAENFPQLNQSIEALPTVVAGWNDVPGIEGLTRFNGDVVTTTPQLRDYFRDDVITAVESQQAAFQRLDTTWPPVNWIPPLLTFLGIAVMIFGAVMIALSRAANLPPAASILTWSIVAVLGLVVLLLVLGLQLYPRLNAGDQVLDGLRPAFTAQRVAGDRAGINFVSEVVDLADPLITAEGAAAEVPQLIAFASERTGLPQATILNLVQNSFPHTAGLLAALPLTELNAEMPRLMDFLATNLGLTPEELSAALGENFPQLTQAITALDPVANGWNSLPVEGLTRFNGEPVTTVPQLRTYLSEDVIPVLEGQQAAFQRLDTTWPSLVFFPPLLTVVGLIVLLYGILMVLLAKGRSAAVT
ncbi:MAG: hypothetical protein ACRD0K_07975 [Egibacteraceae bacterium]